MLGAEKIGGDGRHVTSGRFHASTSSRINSVLISSLLRATAIVVFLAILPITSTSRTLWRPALALTLAVPLGVWLAYVVTREPLEQLVTAASKPQFRVTEGRLYRSPYGCRPRMKVTGAERSQPNPDLAELAAKVLSKHGGRSHYAAGIAQLVTGRIDNAVDSLTAATAGREHRAEAWNDLSVAYLERTMRDHDVRAGLRAVAAARRSFDLREAPAPLFNLAVALQTLGLHDASVAAIDRYLRIDSDSPWADELRERMRVMKHIPFTSQIPALRNSVMRGDAKAIDAIVRQYPQHARTWCETAFLAQWAKEHLVKHTDTELDFVTEIGRALRRVNGDAEIEDAIAVIRTQLSSHQESSVNALAHAHVDYDLARRLYAQRDVEGALPRFLDAQRAFAKAGSPMSYVVRYYIASARLDQNQPASAERILQKLDAKLPPRYAALRALLMWELGTAVGRQGAIYESVVLYERAAKELDVLGERENATTVRSALTHSLTALGRTDEAWKIRSRIFAEAAGAERTETLQAALSAAGHDAILDADWNVAETIFTLALDAQHTGPGLNLRRRVRYLVSRAQALWMLGRRDDAFCDLRRAALSASSIRSRALNDSSAVDVALTEARLVRSSEPARAIELLNSAIDFLESTRQTADIVALYLERARAYRTAGDREAWTSDLRRAVDLVEDRRRSTEQQSDDYIAAEREVFAEATDCFERQQPEEAFSIADAGRTRLLNDQAAVPATVGRIRAILGGALMAHYTVIGREALVFWMTVTEFGHARVRFDAHHPDLLLEPFASRMAAVRRLIVVPDRELSGISFASLRNPNTRRLLVEDVAVVVAPSASFYLQSQTRTHLHSERPRAVIVGDPAFDPDLFPRYTRLAGAAAEAVEIGTLYAQATVLLSGEATTKRFLETAAAANIVHIAAHAQTSAGDPTLSALLFAPSPGHSGALTVRAIREKLPMRNRLVVLAACRTGQTEGFASANLAFAFLSTGSVTVVGTTHDIPDDASRLFSVMLHRLLKDGKPPAEAVREAQLTMARSRSPHFSNEESWSSFQVYGSGD